jgi:tetratricopeptide (TPR) repeat protein
MSNRFLRLSWPPVFLIGLSAFFLGGCSVYYNTYFNAEKAHGQAIQLREKRLELNPEDTLVVSPEEKAKLERAIVKSSKVLELWPDNKKYAPKAVFLIAESYLLMEDYDQAALKYAEFIRYFPAHEKIPVARAHRAKALYLDGQKLNARDELAALLATNPQGEVKREALLLSARMQVDENSGAAGLALYETLLDEGAFPTPEARVEAHWQAAKLAFGLKQWEKARGHALSPEIGILPPRLQYRNHKLAILCLYELGRYDEGIAEVSSLLKRKQYRQVRPDLQLLQARGFEGKKDWAAANALYRKAAQTSGRTAVSAEAYYRIGLHFWTVNDREDSARVYFDSAAASGRQFEFGALGDQKSQALGRIRELRVPDTTGSYATRPHYQGFTIAEIFWFDLQRADSARVHLNRIVSDTAEDSVHTRRAFYALAYLEEERGDKARADSLYAVLMARYPGTEWAKQAEKNRGMPPTVQTIEDKAHILFLEAERRRFAGEPVASRVIPAYREVVTQYPASQEAGKALFVIAFLREEAAVAPPLSAVAVDSAKAAYQAVLTAYPGTIYAEKASGKLEGEKMPDPGGGQGAPDESTGEPDDVEQKPVVESVDPKDEEDLY